MNEQTISQDRLAKEIDALLAPYPDPMSRNDFRIACHIGTRTSLYLLQSGLVPCLHTGKRTRCYKIAKADVAAYLRRRLTEPEHYAPSQRVVQELSAAQTARRIPDPYP